jgi:hypothetical protein
MRKKNSGQRPQAERDAQAILARSAGAIEPVRAKK